MPCITENMIHHMKTYGGRCHFIPAQY